MAPLRAFAGPGNRLADAATPALRAVVDYGYPDNDPLANPDHYAPARLVPTSQETNRFINDFSAGVTEGVDIWNGENDSAVTDKTDKADEVGDQLARPLVRQSLDFSPKARSESKSRRSGAALVESAVDGVRKLAQRLTAGPAERPAPTGDAPGHAGEDAAGD